MHSYTKHFQPVIQEMAKAMRHNRKLSKDEMAELLHIDSRSYADLESGKYCFSTTSLIFLQLMMTTEEEKTFKGRLKEAIRNLDEATQPYSAV